MSEALEASQSASVDTSSTDASELSSDFSSLVSGEVTGDEAELAATRSEASAMSDEELQDALLSNNMEIASINSQITSKMQESLNTLPGMPASMSASTQAEIDELEASRELLIAKGEIYTDEIASRG